MDKRTVKRVPYQKPTLERQKGWVVITGASI
jgi:hypothetical protein